MIRFLAGSILGALIGYAMASLSRSLPEMSAAEVKRRTNVVPLNHDDREWLRDFVLDDDLYLPENAGA